MCVSVRLTRSRFIRFARYGSSSYSSFWPSIVSVDAGDNTGKIVVVGIPVDGLFVAGKATFLRHARIISRCSNVFKHIHN